MSSRKTVIGNNNRKGQKNMATITFKDATQDGIILPEHYILTTTPKDRRVIVTKNETGFKETQKFTLEAGKPQLWRLEQEEDGLKLWGEPTKEELTLCGQDGFQRGPDTMHRVIRELYDMQGTFDKTQACSLKEKEYLPSKVQKAYQAGREYERQDEENIKYWLASYCGNYANVGVFFVDLGRVYYNCLWASHRGAYYHALRVRPKAIPKPTLLLEREGCDGSYEHPWICLSK